MKASRTLLLLLTGALSVVALYAASGLLYKVDLRSAFSEVGSAELVAALLLLLASDVVKAARAYLVAKLLGARPSFSAYVASRLMGNFAGLLTPSSLGAQPVRTAVALALTRSSPEPVVVAFVLDSFYDAVVASLIALVASALTFPGSALVAAASATILFLWLTALLGLGAAEGFWVKLAKKSLGKLFTKEELELELRRRYKTFAEAVNRGLQFEVNAVGILLTAAAFLASAASFAALLGWEGSAASGLASYAMAYATSYVMSAMPTPGGSGFFEYGLGIVLNPKDALAWRACFIAYSAASLPIALLFLRKAREEALKTMKGALSSLLGARRERATSPSSS